MRVVLMRTLALPPCAASRRRGALSCSRIAGQFLDCLTTPDLAVLTAMHESPRRAREIGIATPCLKKDETRTRPRRIAASVFF